VASGDNHPAGLDGGIEHVSQIGEGDSPAGFTGDYHIRFFGSTEMGHLLDQRADAGRYDFCLYLCGVCG
jgi:hypothetical protein